MKSDEFVCDCCGQVFSNPTGEREYEEASEGLAEDEMATICDDCYDKFAQLLGGAPS